MVFSSITFLYLFLPLNLLIYFLSPSRDLRNIVTVFFSFVFYTWGEPVWITLLIFSSTLDYVIGKVIQKNRNTWRAQAALATSITLNLSLLGVFKYSGFIVDTINQALSLNIVINQFSLPIGISFYTFQTISYVVDVYRNDTKAESSYLRFLMFVSLYHQLVAGPIVRYRDIADEILEREHSYSNFARGFHRFMIGLLKKVLIANVAGELVVQYLDGDFGVLSVAEGWFGLLMYSIQIYFDFSGYSDMAIGLGLMIGFHYQENFQYPYISKSVTEFWRRWHISLGSFFRDYVYIPLGGNRRWAYRNLFVIWGLTGLWHGASWNFVLWGLYYGLLIFIEKAFLLRLLRRLPAVLAHAYLLFFAVLGWSLFYFTDLGRLLDYLRVIFGQTDAALLGPSLLNVMAGHAGWLILAICFSAPLYPKIAARLRRLPLREAHAHALILAVDLLMLLIATSMLVGKSYNPFLYFRF
ncbi:MBOAT family protein [Myxococcota bacterium]|nr:MBOAT family protein [Myxococcota bacterium]MBU1429875.1 MBOAT family protein [Myxococcota bacterium]MBU1896862.1 MBOAT family protein [Myxococcota bacterium]